MLRSGIAALDAAGALPRYDNAVRLSGNWSAACDLGGSSRLKAGLGAATLRRRPAASAPADDRGSPGEAGAEGGQRDQLSW